MEHKAVDGSDQPPVPEYTDAQLLQFALQLAAPCNHCSLKAQIALIDSKLECSMQFDATQDAQFLDARTVLCGAVFVLAGLDEAEAEQELAMIEAPSQHIH